MGAEQRGRKSGVELEVAGGTHLLPGTKLSPPASLNPALRKTWEQVVSSRPTNWFGPEHIPLLEQYCRHKATADSLAARLEEWSKKPSAELSTSREIRPYIQLRRMHEQETKMLISLATRMRLTQQSTYGPRKANTERGKAMGRKPWERSA